MMFFRRLFFVYHWCPRVKNEDDIINSVVNAVLSCAFFYMARNFMNECAQSLMCIRNGLNEFSSVLLIKAFDLCTDTVQSIL
jgi:hypothetical protein